MTADTFDPALLEGEEFQLNPYPALKRLRDEHPVWQHPRQGVWFVTRYEDVVAGFLDHDVLSSTIFEQSHSAVFGPSLTAMDGDEHTQKRAIIAPEFVGRKLEAFLPVIEDNVRRLIVGFTEKAARELVEGFIDRRETDLVDTFSTRLPVNVIVDMLALPQSDTNGSTTGTPPSSPGSLPTPSSARRASRPTRSSTTTSNRSSRSVSATRVRTSSRSCAKPRSRDSASPCTTSSRS